MPALQPTLALVGSAFIPDWSQLRPFIAEAWLIATIIAVLISPFLTRRTNIAAGAVALVGLIAALAGLLTALPAAQSGGFGFRGMLVSDSFAATWKILLLIFAIGIVLMWFVTTRSAIHEGDGPEFFTLLLGATLGMCLMASTTNLLMIVLAVEMASLPSYVLAGFRKTDKVGSEASLKYVLFGAATSSIMIYGLSMLYGLYGTMQLDVLAGQFAAGDANLPMILAIAGLLAGIGFKISAVPFHFWCPDVFEGAGIDVAAFLSVASKGAGLALLMRILVSFGQASVEASQILLVLAMLVGCIGVITATVGNTAAYVQTNIKRLLAYSSIAHAGYMLCLLAMFIRPSNAANRSTGDIASALLVYLAVYLFMNLGAFTVAGLVARATGSEKIEDFAGLGRRNPLLALAMAAFMISLVGLPPMAGFVAKLNVLIVLASGGGWWWTLVAAIGLNTVFSLYYYARILRVMYLVDSDAPGIAAPLLGRGLAVACVVALVGMFIGFNPLFRACKSGADMILKQPAAPALVTQR